jgi:hypothetical protein
MTPREKAKELIKEDFELRSKREKAFEMPRNSLTKEYIESLGKSTLEKKLEKQYEEFTLLQFLKKTGL